MATTLPAINKIFENEGLTVRLYKGQPGDDYFYFEYDAVDSANYFETKSEYVARLNHLEKITWLKLGREFDAKCKAELKEMV